MVKDAASGRTSQHETNEHGRKAICSPERLHVVSQGGVSNNKAFRFYLHSISEANEGLYCGHRFTWCSCTDIGEDCVEMRACDKRNLGDGDLPFFPDVDEPAVQLVEIDRGYLCILGRQFHSPLR